MGIGVYIAKFMAGGALVCIFALISEVFAPKRFAGLFSAAPSVLTAGLAVTLLTQGAAKASLQAAGAVGLIAYCLAATPAVRRFKSLGGSAVTTLLWLIVAASAYIVLTQVVPS